MQTEGFAGDVGRDLHVVQVHRLRGQQFDAADDAVPVGLGRVGILVRIPAFDRPVAVPVVHQHAQPVVPGYSDAQVMVLGGTEMGMTGAGRAVQPYPGVLAALQQQGQVATGPLLRDLDVALIPYRAFELVDPGQVPASPLSIERTLVGGLGGRR